MIHALEKLRLLVLINNSLPSGHVQFPLLAGNCPRFTEIGVPFADQLEELEHRTFNRTRIRLPLGSSRIRF